MSSSEYLFDTLAPTSFLGLSSTICHQFQQGAKNSRLFSSDSNGKCCDPSSLSLPNGPDGRCACCPGSGDQCCGDSCFASTGDAFCCGGNVHQKGDYGGSAYASCCDYQSPFNSNTQYCCGGNVYDKSAYGGPGLAACCSDNQPYNPNIQFCCAGQAAKFSDYGGFGAARCCGDMDAYNSNYQSCCGSPSFGYGVGVGDSCCAIFPYSSATEKCCYGSQVVSIWQSC